MHESCGLPACSMRQSFGRVPCIQMQYARREPDGCCACFTAFGQDFQPSSNVDNLGSTSWTEVFELARYCSNNCCTLEERRLHKCREVDHENPDAANSRPLDLLVQETVIPTEHRECAIRVAQRLATTAGLISLLRAQTSPIGFVPGLRIATMRPVCCSLTGMETGSTEQWCAECAIRFDGLVAGQLSATIRHRDTRFSCLLSGPVLGNCAASNCRVPIRRGRDERLERQKHRTITCSYPNLKRSCCCVRAALLLDSLAFGFG